jgi:hypothetical protein
LTESIFPLPVTVIEAAFRTLLMPAIGTASLMKPRLVATVQAAIALSAITTRAEKERPPAFTAQTNSQPQNNFAMIRHPPSQAGLDNGYGFVAL